MANILKDLCDLGHVHFGLMMTFVKEINYAACIVSIGCGLGHVHSGLMMECWDGV